MRVEADGDEVVKTAESGAERRRLAHEAAVLRSVAHPGIVRLRRVEGGDPPDRLILARVEGTAVSDLGPQSARDVASWGAAVATILADLHERGWVHGSVGPDHVLLDGRGRPVLCGFGSAGRASEAGGPQAAAADISALARLVSDRLGPGEARLRRALARWDTGRRRARDARALAALLVRRVPDAGQEGSREPTGLRARLSARGRQGTRAAAPTVAVTILATAVLAGAAGLLVGGVLSGRPSGQRPELGLPAYLVESAPGEQPVVVIGRWGCGPPRPAVLDLASGTIWAYPSWPAAGGRVSGVVLTKVAGATGLAAAAGRKRCDRLLALRDPAGPPVVIDVPVAVSGGSGR